MLSLEFSCYLRLPLLATDLKEAVSQVGHAAEGLGFFSAFTCDTSWLRDFFPVSLSLMTEIIQVDVYNPHLPRNFKGFLSFQREQYLKGAERKKGTDSSAGSVMIG